MVYLSEAPVGNYISISIHNLFICRAVVSITSHLKDFLLLDLFIVQLCPVADKLIRCIGGNVGKLPIERSEPVKG